MTIGIMQPYLFPYIGYFQTIEAADKYVIYDDVQYIKGGWINRNNILVGGRKTLFTISLKEASANKLINEIDINDDFNKFLKTLDMAYSRAPYKDQVMTLIREICNYQDKNLARFTGNSLMKIAEYLNLETEFIYSSTLRKDDTLRSQEKVLAICKELGASHYVNAIGGTDLYNKEYFKERKVTLSFVKTLPYTYKQFTGEFIANLSIIDVMMFNTPEQVREMINNYELI